MIWAVRDSYTARVRVSATAALDDPHWNLLMLAVGEAEGTLRGFLPVFGK
jgi:hypothetical protein